MMGRARGSRRGEPVPTAQATRPWQRRWAQKVARDRIERIHQKNWCGPSQPAGVRTKHEPGRMAECWLRTRGTSARRAIRPSPRRTAGGTQTRTARGSATEDTNAPSRIRHRKSINEVRSLLLAIPPGVNRLMAGLLYGAGRRSGAAAGPAPVPRPTSLFACQ